LSPFVIAFLRKKSLFLKKIITFNNFASIYYNFLKKLKSKKKSLKTASNEKLLRAASQKIDFFFKGERKYGLKDWTNFVTKNPFYIVVSKQTRLFV